MHLVAHIVSYIILLDTLVMHESCHVGRHYDNAQWLARRVVKPLDGSENSSDKVNMMKLNQREIEPANSNVAISHLLCVRIETCADEVDFEVDLRSTLGKCAKCAGKDHKLT